MSLSGEAQLNRFCRQYLQLEANLVYPDQEQLRKHDFQQCLYMEVFNEYALPYPPPQRYQIRVLKELTKRIEASIQNWEEEVLSIFLLSFVTITLI
jgi:hypothetical protein